MQKYNKIIYKNIKNKQINYKYQLIIYRMKKKN